MQRRQVKINARILLPDGLKVHFIRYVIKNRREQDIEKVLDMVFVFYLPLDGLRARANASSHSMKTP